MGRKTQALKSPGTRGTLTPMKVSSGFVAFVIEQLGALKGLRSKAMFGGVGLYSDEVFFGLLARDTLFLKVDASNRGQYEAAGMTAFKPYADKPMVMPYFEVPAAVLEDADTLVTWARQSVRVASGAAGKAKARRTGAMAQR
jgi:DNA transformation protein and related proteins